MLVSNSLFFSGLRALAFAEYSRMYFKVFIILPPNRSLWRVVRHPPRLLQGATPEMFLQRLCSCADVLRLNLNGQP